MPHVRGLGFADPRRQNRLNLQKDDYCSNFTSDCRATSVHSLISASIAWMNSADGVPGASVDIERSLALKSGSCATAFGLELGDDCRRSARRGKQPEPE